MPSSAESVYRFLNAFNLPYEVISHKPIYTVADIDFSTPGSQVKNLLLQSRRGNIYLAILPDDKRADLTQIASQLHEKRLHFVSPEQLYQLMRLQPGTVTPFGLLNDRDHQVHVLIDDSIDRQALIGFHPNVNDATLILSFHDLLTVLHLLGYQPVWLALTTTK